MKTIRFEPGGGDLQAVIRYEGLLAAAYVIKLSEADSNAPVFYKTGDNQNPEDDRYPLPSPPSENNNRIIRLSSEFYGLDIKATKDYRIVLEIFQGGNLLESEVDVGELAGKTQSSLLFVKLTLSTEVNQ